MKLIAAPSNLLSIAAVVCSGCATATDFAQRADYAFEPTVERPTYAPGQRPVVVVDAAHGNFHTIDGRYGAFARLLEADGYVVRSGDSAASTESLSEADVYVFSNALHSDNMAEWKLPTPPAFTDDEIECIREWVSGGGSLLLIADHMPFPGATADLAAAFGLVFYNGFARGAEGGRGIFTASRANGGLADHAIVRGRTEAERIESVMVFTGQAFRAVEPIEPLLLLPADAEVWLPSVAWEFSDATPRVSTAGLLQGAVRRYGEGRVAVFGEAAMFTAQQQVRGDRVRYMGMNHPDAPDNQQFVLNVMHWLTGLLD